MPQDPIQIDPQRVRVMQIIVIALVTGVATFAAVAVVQAQGKPPGVPFLAYVGAGVATIVVVARMFVPRIVAITQGRQASAGFDLEKDQQKLVDTFCGTYQTKVVMENALLEGAAFLNLIAYMVETQTMSLAVAGGLVSIMLLSFPTGGRVESWVREQFEAIELDRQD